MLTDYNMDLYHFVSNNVYSNLKLKGLDDRIYYKVIRIRNGLKILG